jgi:hypothetical protein
MTENSIVVKLKKYFKDFCDQDIKIYFRSSSDAYKFDNMNNFKAYLGSQLITSTLDVCSLIGFINQGSSDTLDFEVDKLKFLTESDYQKNILTPLSKHEGSNIMDTHATNAIAKFLCVSGIDENGEISFASKPDSIHKYAPIMIEVKSRRTTSSTCEASLHNMTLNNITLDELDLFQQCLERVIVQSQFRAYLSKFVVLASTGYLSWCFFYEQNFTENENFRRVKVMLVSSDDVNVIWNGFSDAVRNQGCSFFMTKHGEAIINTLRRTCNINLHSIRVNLSNISHSTVYYVTYPSVEGVVSSNVKLYAFKVMSDKTKFDNEIKNLRIIKEKWNFFYRNFYYITDSTDTDNIRTTYPISSIVTITNLSYDWFISLNSNLLAGSLAEIGVIIMRPALRKLNSERDDEKIFGELLESLSIVHSANILHCDLRPSNCLKFARDGWQVVDFDLAVPITDLHSGAGECLLVYNSPQMLNAGYKVQEKARDSIVHDKVTVEWTKNDDIEMLHLACNHMYN